MTWHRLVVGCLAGLCLAAAGQAPPAPTLEPPEPRLNLAERLQTTRMPAASPAEPDALWEAAGQATQPAASRWSIGAGERWVGRATLAPGGKPQVLVVEVPVPSIDEVRVWHRSQGGPWRQAVAGDQVPQSRWPFANQFPAFPVSVDEAPVDLLVAASNAAYLRVPVFLLTDAEFRGNNVRRANLSGLVMGLGGMFAIVCAVGAAAARRRPQVLLAGVAAWTLFAIACNNGYMAVWITPDWTWFNDAGKHFSGMVMAGLMVPLVAETLDPASLSRRERAVAWGMALAALAYAVLQQLVLPQPWRLAGAAVTALSCVLASAVLCLLARWRRAGHTGWVAAAVASMVGASLLPFAATDQVAGLDLRAAAVGALIYAALLLLRQAQVLQERYGRDVLSRAAISASRDPLTALWSYEGFKLRHEEALLREAAGQGQASLMLFLLPGLERSEAEHGVELNERAVVRFAAALQRLLGPRWAIARLSKTRFSALSLQPVGASELVHTATRVLSQCSRIMQPVNLVGEFDLRIACSHQGAGQLPLGELLRQLEEAGRTLDAGKRITLL